MARQGVYHQKGNIIDYLNNSGSIISSGQVIPLLARIGFAVADIHPGEVGGVAVAGVFTDVPAEDTVAFSVGDSLFWDSAANKLTKTETDNTPAGWSVTAKNSDKKTATIKLIG